MLSDYELFKQLCEERQVIILPDILEAIKKSSHTGILELSCQSIIPPICDIISRVLVSSTTIKSVDLSDCILISKGLRKIFDALCGGSSVSSLNLKGNNISGLTVSQLGRIFQYNNTLKYLNVEWNCLGCDTVFFERFCEGLAINNSIEEVDLKYNQISFQCAEALSKVIKRNKSIKILNLSRNALGLQGGQQILDAMRENNSIIKLNLRGNSISDEIIGLIDNLIYRNQNSKIIGLSFTSKSIFSHENLNESHSLTSNKTNGEDKADDRGIQSTNNKLELPTRKNPDKYSKIPEFDSNHPHLPFNYIANNSISLESKKSHRNNHLLDEILNSKDFEASSKITDLNKILQDRKSVIDTLMRDNSSKEAELEATKSLVNQLEVEITKMRGDYERIIAEKSKEMEDIEKSQKIAEENFEKTRKDLEIKEATLEIQSNEWKSKLQQCETDIHEKSVEITILNEKLKSKLKHYEEIIMRYRRELVGLRKEWKEKEKNNRIEVNVLNRVLKETAQALKHCQKQFEESQKQLYGTAEEYSEATRKLNEMENINVKYVKLKEVFHKSQEEKSLIEENFNQSQRKVGSLKRQVASLETELAEPQRLYNLLKTEFEQEKEKNAKLKEELCAERSRLKERDIQMQKHSQQIDTLNTQIRDMQKLHLDDIKERDREKEKLNEIIACKNRELSDLRANEAQRTAQLYMAFTKYLGSINSTSLLPYKTLDKENIST